MTCDARRRDPSGGLVVHERNDRTQCWFFRDVAAELFCIVRIAQEPGLGKGVPVRTATAAWKKSSRAGPHRQVGRGRTGPDRRL
jgi:hypothetical protein